jgi:hypothetical protein
VNYSSGNLLVDFKSMSMASNSKVSSSIKIMQKWSSTATALARAIVVEHSQCVNILGVAIALIDNYFYSSLDE